MRAEDIHNNTDPNELRNLIKNLRVNQRPPSVVIVNQSPDQYTPPGTTPGSGGSLAWFNLRDYGAVGDGVTDDTAAVNSAIAALNAVGRGVLYGPAGKYLCSSGLIDITADCVVMGDGAAGVLEYDTVYLTKFICTSGTDDLFTVSSPPLHVEFRDLMLECTHSAPTAGAGIHVAGAYSYTTTSASFFNVRMSAFYAGIDIDAATEVYMDNCQLMLNRTFGIRLAYANFTITNSYFNGFHMPVDPDTEYYGTTAIDGSAGAAGIISGCKFSYYRNGIRFTTTSVALDTLITNNSFYGITYGHAISIVGPSDEDEWYYRLVIANNNVQMLDPYGLSSGESCISLSHCQYVVISGNNLVGADIGQACIELDTVADARITGNLSLWFDEYVSQTSCSNVVIVEPSDAAPQDIDAAADAGTGDHYSRDDHMHQGVHSLAKSGSAALYGDVTLSAGSNVTLTQSGNDIQISSSGGTGGGSYQPLANGDPASPALVFTPDGDVIMVPF